ncbi:uncharacterized protein LOC114271222 isoform X2 [Camellia sinensis]|uniref:uncharacterized protein LOC114271222 isoform X2 n=1 Tax=Camellia sinensis TaxID=4442 RepID=UPI0010361E89|nr:uncharacterized protein LOC114271222 isoform X2 [Camellia sinensis]
MSQLSDRSMDPEIDSRTYLSSSSDTSDTSDDDDNEVFSLSKLFGYDEELKRIPPVAPRCDTHDGDNYDYDYDDDRDMTEDEYRVYKDQVLKSDGFDVANIPGVNEFHQILPMDITYNTKHYEWYSQLAVDEYNRRFKDTNKELEFVKVLKAMSQAACVLRFYMTFSAKDLADGGNIKTYQAVVLLGVGSKMSVLSFRLKPPADEQGSDSHGKEWFWKEDNLCNGGCVGD